MTTLSIRVPDSLHRAIKELAAKDGYSMNQMGKGILLNERGQELVDATYRVLGFRSNTSGSWQL